VKNYQRSNKDSASYSYSFISIKVVRIEVGKLRRSGNAWEDNIKKDLHKEQRAGSCKNRNEILVL